jgi:general stress protein 26
MTSANPVTSIDARYGNPEAEPRSWDEARAILETAEIYWLTTVRRDGRPHVTPLLALWIDNSLYFTTGSEEQKALNLQANTHCAVTTGCNSLNEGLDIVIEGTANLAHGQEKLERVAATYQSKYGWTFHARDGEFYNDEHEGKPVLLYEVAPAKILGFGKGEPFSQTRWLFT